MVKPPFLVLQHGYTMVKPATFARSTFRIASFVALCALPRLGGRSSGSSRHWTWDGGSHWTQKRMRELYGSVSKPCTPGEHQNSW